MIDRAYTAQILHFQWMELLEEERDNLPTLDHRVTIGTVDEDIWMEIDGSSDDSWDPGSLGVPPMLGTVEPGSGGSADRIVTGKEIVGTFSQFVCEVIVALSRALPPGDAVRTAIQELRSQLAGIREPLTKEKQRGLVGELGVLRMAISELGDSALETWVGPTDTYDSLHDFAGSKLHIEAKSTNTNPPVVQINELAQLDWRGQVPLILGVSHITEHEDGSNLHDHVSEVASMFGSNAARIRFYNLCRFAGYHAEDVFGHRYTTLHRVNSVRWFVIDGDSPIVQPELLSEIPSSVLSFKYDLSANDLQETPGFHWGDLQG
jgi:hypothetical protein